MTWVGWVGWVLVATIALSTTANILRVGSWRAPLTPGDAAAITAINALLIFGIMTVGTGSL